MSNYNGTWSKKRRVFYWPRKAKYSWKLTKVSPAMQALVILAGLTKAPKTGGTLPYIDFGDGSLWDFPYYKFTGVWKYAKRKRRR